MILLLYLECLHCTDIYKNVKLLDNKYKYLLNYQHELKIIDPTIFVYKNIKCGRNKYYKFQELDQIKEKHEKFVLFMYNKIYIDNFTIQYSTLYVYYIFTTSRYTIECHQNSFSISTYDITLELTKKDKCINFNAYQTPLGLKRSYKELDIASTLKKIQNNASQSNSSLKAPNDYYFDFHYFRIFYDKNESKLLLEGHKIDLSCEVIFDLKSISPILKILHNSEKFIISINNELYQSKISFNIWPYVQITRL